MPKRAAAAAGRAPKDAKFSPGGRPHCDCCYKVVYQTQCSEEVNGRTRRWECWPGYMKLHSESILASRIWTQSKKSSKFCNGKLGDKELFIYVCLLCPNFVNSFFFKFGRWNFLLNSLLLENLHLRPELKHARTYLCKNSRGEKCFIK